MEAPVTRPADPYPTSYPKSPFIDRGVATFAFDKPGCGESSGDWRHYGLEGRAEQLIAALDLVRSHPAIIGERVGLFGHSQGGWLVHKLAGQDVAPAFAVASSAPTIGVQQQILYDCEQTIRNHGYGQQELRDALSLARALQQAAIEGAAFASVSDQLLKPASRQSWFSRFATIDDASDWQHFKLLISELHQPLLDLKRVLCPFLAVYGALDTLLPAWQGAEESGRALATAENPDATVVVFPLGDHRMQHPDTQGFVGGYLDLLGAWIADRAH